MLPETRAGSAGERRPAELLGLDCSHGGKAAGKAGSTQFLFFTFPTQHEVPEWHFTGR